MVVSSVLQHMIAAGTKIFSRKLKTNDAMNQNVREELPPQFAFEHEPYHAPGIILEEVNDPHEEFIKVTYWMPYQKLLLIPRTGAIAPTCERNALVHRSNMMFLEPKGEFSESAWNQKVSWANLCWHIRGERLVQNPTSAAAPTLGAPPTSAAISSASTMNQNNGLSSRDTRCIRGCFKCNLEVLSSDKYNMDEWQESLWFEAELEAEHAAEQQAATKKAKVEVEPEQVEGVIKGRIECGAGAASTSSEGYIVKLLRNI